MTDERLEQLLENALAPEISDSEIRIKRKVRKGKMNRAMKTGLAFAACLAVIAAAGFGVSYFKAKDNLVSVENTEDKNTEDNIGNTVTLADGVDEKKPIKPFTLTAFSAKMDENVEVPVIIDNRQGWSIGGCEDQKTVDYSILTSFRCEGENIESVKYSVKGGFFEIVEIPDKSIIVDATDYTGDMAPSASGAIFDENDYNIARSRYVTEYTLNYDTQQNDTTYFYLQGKKEGDKLYKDIFIYEDTDMNKVEEKKAAAYSELLKDMEITCTVYYKDGTTVNATIAGCGKAMTYEESRIPIEENGGVLERNGVPLTLNDKRALIVFKLK